MTPLLLSLALAAAPVPKERSDAEFHKAVDAAREKAVRFLKDKQEADGGWEGSAAPSFRDCKGWTTALVVLALLEAGVPADDPAVVKGAEFLRPIESKWAFVVGIQTRALAHADAKKYAKEIQANADWLLKERKREGWGPLASSFYTVWAITGLHAAAQAGSKLPPDLWPKIREFLLEEQDREGGWPPGSPAYPEPTRDTTVNGLLALTVASKYDARTKFPDAAFERGMDLIFNGRLREREAEEKAPDLTWVETADLGRALGSNEFRVGKVATAWYRNGAETLVKEQRFDGSWKSARERIEGEAKAPVAATACGLFFLGPPKK